MPKQQTTRKTLESIGIPRLTRAINQGIRESLAREKAYVRVARQSKARKSKRAA
jgi:hypothetical protein